MRVSRSRRESSSREGQARELFAPLGPTYDRVGAALSLDRTRAGDASRPPWEIYVRTGLPLAGRLLRNGWREIGDFLGGSIRGFWERHPLERQLGWWHAAGLHGIQARRLSLGGGAVIWGRKTAVRQRRP